MSVVAEQPTRTVEPPGRTPPSAHIGWVGVLSFVFAALCGWVLLPFFVSSSLVVLALTVLASAVVVVVFLMAAGSPSE